MKGKLKKKPLIKEMIVALLFLAMIAFAVSNTIYIRHVAEEVQELAEQSVAEGEAGNWHAAIYLARRACDVWNNADTRTHIALRHQSIENADVALAQHLGLISDMNLDEARGSLRGVQAVMRGVIELEAVRIGSIF